LIKRPALQFLFLIFLFSCAVGPDYKRPDVADLTPSDWGWKIAEPKDEVPKGQWWRVFKDPVLDDLETRTVEGNQDLRVAVARVEEARAAARISRSRFFPELSFNPSFVRQRTSANQPTPIPIPPPLELTSRLLNTYSVPLDLSYEVDLWGRVRRSFEAARAEAEASVSDYQNVLLTLTADVAVNYFLMRSMDSEIEILRRSIELQDDVVRILNDRFIVGTISEAGVEEARAELADAKADLAEMIRRRTETLHALALLCGRPASSFEVAEGRIRVSPPAIPPGLPSGLLERRPDIARAERNLSARNARIGVARAAYFPVVRLTGEAGFLSAKAGNLFSKDSRIWSVGPGISLPLFTAGRTAAEVRQAEAAYEEAQAEYRQTVLQAFKEVEDSLAQIVLFERQAAGRGEALAATKRALGLASVRYEAGATGYLEVLEAEKKTLQHERQEAELSGQRMGSSVRLIKALGGGW
jgi:multidrug efflux system outer membrane protein